MKRSFVSLSFANASRLQIVKLNSSNNKIEAFHTVDLPHGLISKNMVKDSDIMSSIIKEAWEYLKIDEKTVGIVVPEFSSYTKLITLPELGVSELDDAVRWQAKEYLPSKLSKMVLDWKVMGKSEQGIQILTVAIEREVLMSYVDSVVKSGLIPIVIETPSLSLSRVARDNLGKLIIYKNFDETILLIVKDEKIYGTSVENNVKLPELLKFGGRMIKHYSAAEVSEIVIAGFDPKSYNLQEIAKSTDKKVHEANMGISGLDPEQLGNYLIPIALQLKEPSEPSDIKTVNLLPKELVKTYLDEKLRVQVWSLSLITSLFVWSAFVVTLGVYLFLSQQLSTEKRFAPTQKVNLQGNQASVDAVKSINDLSNKIVSLSELSIPPEVIMNLIEKERPPQVSINEYDIDYNGGKVKLKGVASDRQSLLDFKSRMENDADVAKVNIPLSNLEVENNLDYELSFVYSPLANNLEKFQVKNNSSGKPLPVK